MPPTNKPQIPFAQNVLSREGECLWEKLKRKREEARAKAVSDAIDKQLKHWGLEKNRRGRKAKILLLGQSESGQFFSWVFSDPYLKTAPRKVHIN